MLIFESKKNRNEEKEKGRNKIKKIKKNKKKKKEKKKKLRKKKMEKKEKMNLRFLQQISDFCILDSQSKQIHLLEIFHFLSQGWLLQ
jgi:hypothetical protein